MSKARQKEAWTRTGTLLALIEVVNSDGKKKVRFNAAKWNPFSTAEERRNKPRGEPITKDTIGMLKMFVPKGKKKKQKRRSTTDSTDSTDDKNQKRKARK